MVMVMTEKWVNNHKVTCSKCLYVQTIVFYEDELPFRCDEKCLLGYETDYRVPFIEYWDCEHYVKYNILKRIWFKLKNKIYGDVE